MITLSIVLFSIGALIGATLASFHLRGNPPPPRVALIHGAFVGTGLILLTIEAVRGNLVDIGYFAFALTLLMLVAFAGLLLFALHLEGRRLPRALIGIHAFTAVSAYAILVYTHFFL